jgi:hypothetical protein
VKVGIIAEGPADIAVVMNILYGKLGVERKDVIPIRPKLTLDETDLAAKRGGGYKKPEEEEFSNWEIVLEECCKRTDLANFLDSVIDEERLLVVQIDTAEAELKGFDVARPDRRAADYVESMRARVVSKLEGLLGEEVSAKSRFAVAVEETDAWLLALYDPGDKDTGLIRDPKKKLAYLQGTLMITKSEKPKARPGKRGQTDGSRATKKSPFEAASELSTDFRDGELLSSCVGRNKSLQLFVTSLAA